jgi:hypothetical protein
MSFFSTLFAGAKTVLTDVMTGSEAIEPVVTAIPGAGTVAVAIDAGAKAALTTISAGEAIYNAASPEITAIEGYLETLFHISLTPSAIVLTPKTSAATVATASS